MKTLRKLILALSAASASFCFGEIPARFCEYIESVTSGSTATYVETDLKLHYASGKVYVDTQLMCEEFPQKVTYLFGASEDSSVNNKSFLVALDGVNSKIRLDTLYKDNTSYVTANAAPGHRYRFLIRKRYNYSGQRCDLEDVNTGIFSRYGSSASKHNAQATKTFNFFTAKRGSTRNASTVPQRLYSAKIWIDGSTLSGDYIPCVTQSGLCGLYDVVTGTIKLAYPQDNFVASETDSPLARINAEGEIEYSTRITAKEGSQISADGGETWVSNLEIWATKADSFSVSARHNPDVPYAVFTGWSTEGYLKQDLAGVSGLNGSVLTFPSGGVREIAANANVGGYEPNKEMLADGDFELNNLTWNGGGSRTAPSTSYAKAVVSQMGSYLWGVGSGTGNFTNPDLERYNISLPPASYKLLYHAAAETGLSKINFSAQIRDASGGAIITTATNQLPTTYTQYSKTFRYDTGRTTVLRISRTAASNKRNSYDNVSLRMQLPISGLVVTAEPEQYKVDSLPLYGYFPMQVDRTDTFYAPEGKSFLNENQSARGYVRGYRLDTYNVETGEWELGEEVGALSYTHTQVSDECKRLVWLWTAENKITVVSENLTEKVSTNGVDWVESLEEWYPYESYAPIYAGINQNMVYGWLGAPDGTIYGFKNSLIQVPMNAPRSLILGGSEEMTHIWAGPSGNFSVAANWLTPSGEVSLDAPSEESFVYIPPGSICTVDKAFSVLKLAIGDVFNTESSSTVSITFKNGLSTNEVADTLQIGKNTTLTHDGNGSGSVAIQRITLKAGTSISVAKGAIFNLKGKGFNSGKGPAAGAAGKGGGSHAGVGGNNTSVNSAKCYGSIRRPLMPGSGGTTAGGGVVHLISPGPIQFDGQIDATGANGQNYLNGAGGSAFIEAGTFLGTGTIDVRSGTPDASYAYIGGSGRISVVESKATSFGFQGTLNASSLKKRCGPGTVYLEDASHVPGQGDLIVDGFSVQPDSDCVCRLDTTVEGAQDPFGSVTVKRGARLNIPSSVTLKVIKSISTVGGYLTTASTGGAIEFLPASGGVIDVAGTISAYALYCTNSTSATIRFANSSVLETFANGKAEFDSIEGVLSMVPATTEGKWTYAIGESASVKANNIAISNCTASAISFSAIASEDLGGNVNCNILSKPKPGDLIKWTGTQNNQWANPNNWSPARVPNETDVVLISASAVNQPVISGNSVLVNSVTNEQGATLTLSGVNLTVTNNLVSSGSIVIGNNEKLIVSGNGNQIIDFDNTTLKRLFIEKNGGSVAFKKGFKILETFKCNTSNDLLFVFEAGEVYDINQLFVDGMVLNEESGVDCKIAFVSSTLNSKWFLRATNSQRVRGVTVSDCDASIGKTINVGVFAKEEQPSSNINWNFAEDAASEWVGSKNTTFTTSANWLLEKIPNENTSVTVMPKVNQTHTLILSQETKIKNLILGGDDGTVSFTADAKLIVQEDFDVSSKATAVLNFYNQPNEVFNLIVRRGGKITHGSSTTSAVKKLNIEASGDIIVQSGGIISADGVAQGGTSNESTGWAIGASHGGVGNFSDHSKAYGSVFEPYDTGSKGVGGNGGGVVKLTALNKIHISGRVTAYGYVPQGGGGGSGGSVWLTAGIISGNGRVSASSLTDFDNESSYNYTGGGGRIAFYQTQANDWSEFEITVSCSGSLPNKDGENKGGQGTIYWQLPTDVHHGGRITISPPGAILCATVLPGTKDGDVRKAYKDATLELGANANVVIASSSLTQLGGVMQLKDIDIKSTSAKIALNENTLKVLSQAHRNGRNWTQNRDYEASVAAGQINTTLGGKIIWPIGFSVNIR